MLKSICRKMQLKKKEEEPIVTTVEEKCMFDLYNELDDEEDDLQKIAEQTYKILCPSSEEAAKQNIQ